MAFSGTVSILALKDGDFQYTSFAGTTAGLQAAIDSLGGGKGKVWIGPGTLETSTAIWIHSGCHLQGSGINQTIIKRTSMSDSDAANSGGVIVTSQFGSNGTLTTSSTTVSDITISDLTVDGNESTFSAITTANLIPAGVYLNYCDGARIDRVRAQNCLGDGFRIRFCRNAHLSQVETNTIGQWAVVAARNAVNFIGDYAAAGNWGYNYSLSGLKAVTSGDEVFQCSGIYLCTITNVEADGFDELFEVSPTTITAGTWGNWTISNMTAINGLTYFFSLNDGQAANGYTLKDVTITNCTCTGHASLHDGGAVGMSGNDSDVQVSEWRMSNCIFKNLNTLDTTPRNWVDIQPNTNGADEIYFSNCSFYGKSGSVRAASDIGLMIRAPVTNVSVTGCYFKDVPGRGIYISDNNAYSSPVLNRVTLDRVVLDGCNDPGFSVISSSATGTGTLQNVTLINCVAKDTSKVTSGVAFRVFNSQAGATIQKVKFIGCRAYKTSGTSMTYGLQLSQSAGTVDDIEITNCDFDGVQTGWFTLTGTHTLVKFSDFSKTNSTASGTSITLPQGDFITITGTTTITSITPWFVWDRRPITLYFSSTAAMTDGSNLKLAGDLTGSAGQTITLRYDGSNWQEIARSAN